MTHFSGLAHGQPVPPRTGIILILFILLLSQRLIGEEISIRPVEPGRRLSLHRLRLADIDYYTLKLENPSGDVRVLWAGTAENQLLGLTHGQTNGRWDSILEAAVEGDELAVWLGSWYDWEIVVVFASLKTGESALCWLDVPDFIKSGSWAGGSLRMVGVGRFEAKTREGKISVLQCDREYKVTIDGRPFLTPEAVKAGSATVTRLPDFEGRGPVPPILYPLLPYRREP